MRRHLFVASAILLSFSSLAAFCQQLPKCPPPASPNASHKSKPAAPVVAPTPIVVNVQAPPPATAVPSVTVNARPNFDSLAAALTLFADAKMNETHTLDNLGDVNSHDRADLAKRYAEARINQLDAEYDLTESQAGLNNAEKSFTNTKRKSYVFLRVLDDLSGVAGSYLGATKISSSITTTQGSVNGGSTSLTSGPVSVVGGGATIAGSANSSNSNLAQGGQGGTGGQGGKGGAGGNSSSSATGGAGGNGGNSSARATGGSATADPIITNSNNNKNNATAASSSVASQQQGQGQGQSQSQSQSQTAPTTGSGGGGNQPPCPPKGGQQ
jgi:hypothetical protein